MGQRSVARVVAVSLLAAAQLDCRSSESRPPTEIHSLGQVIKQLGFTELQPPSKLLAPGTIIYIESESPLRVGIVCTAENALGADLPVLSSATVSQEAQSALGRGFGLAGDFLTRIRANVEYSKIQAIHISLSNVKVSELALDQAMERAEQRTEGCKRAIDTLVEAEKSIAMITRVLEADVHYSFEFDRQAGAEAKAQSATIAGLAAELGARSQTATETTVQGDALYWGIHDMRMMAVVDPQPNTRSFTLKGEPLLPGGAIEVNPTPRDQ